MVTNLQHKTSMHSNYDNTKTVAVVLEWFPSDGVVVLGVSG